MFRLYRLSKVCESKRSSLYTCGLSRTLSLRHAAVALLFVPIFVFVWSRNRHSIYFRQYKYVFSSETIVEQRSSKLHNITIAESNSLRMLRFDMLGYEGVIHLDDPHLVLFDYMRLQLLTLLWNPEPERILIIGLGAAILPRILHSLSPMSHIEVVEIDPVVIHMAKKYFFLPKVKAIQIHIEDGRQFLERQPSKRYDLVLIDVFTTNGRIPHPLRTLECLGEYQRVLKSSGLLAANFLYEEESRYRQTYERALFKQIYRGNAEHNYVLIALHKQAKIFNQEQLQSRARQLQKTKILSDFNWLEEVKHLRNGNEDRWNRSATVFTDQIYENRPGSSELS